MVGIVKEVPGGAHRFPKEQAAILKEELIRNLMILNKTLGEDNRRIRNEKFLDITGNI